MVEEIATVVAVESGGVWLQTRSQSSCSACSAQDSCSSGQVAKAFTARDYRFFVPLQDPLLAQHVERHQGHATPPLSSSCPQPAVPHHVIAALTIGQKVRIGMSEQLLMQSALRVYLYPLLAFMLAVGFLHSMAVPEGWQLLGGMLAMLPAYLWARHQSQRFDVTTPPVQILAVLL
jgi:sigma-E factor negative regulatory protein RseC